MMFLAGFLSGILLTVLILLIIAPKLMFSVSESKYDFDETVAIIEQSTNTNNWSMPHQYDLQGTMSKHGFEINPVKVFSICKPDIAIHILESDNGRHISAMMPCRIAVFEKKDGKTYVARMNAGMLSRLLGSNVKAVMGEAGQDSEQILSPLFY